MQSPTSEYRDSVGEWLRSGFIALITLSSGLMAAFSGAELTEIAVVSVAGLVVGFLVVWIAFPSPD